ncbi:hypothetical protein SAMN05443428_11125 [Caloramator quimbayensis]|uniref:Uncharacterized protein n=1 Tax=Caloramator quimbayensis TaxID=1147123 RepID=A0A1T4XNV6_9CLOT|nr:hypothetical protein [Caloramator quimbayensis]SKA91234.1 hypothetical protein SAMN05443428_11125 [Caloramator quimbayensis]
MKKIKKLFSIIIAAIVIAAIIPVYSFAQDDDGKIDLYRAFSNQNDIMKNQVGSRVYKWSMYLPDDGMVYKSDRANFFNMSTNSYRANIQLMVSKNEDELTLEDILYKMQNSSRQQNYWIWGDKEYNMEIATDSYNQRFIKVVKTEKYYDYFLVDKAAEEFSDYIENRIYIANNYIYNLTVQMQGEFYRGHQDMFNKLVNSFKTSYDSNNPNIKELSESVSTTREFKNNSYGWKITLSPYYKVDGVPNSRNQSFSPVYSDEELNMMNTKTEENNDVKINEGITVSLISSSGNKETASSFAQKEIDMIKNNYNSSVYEILKNEPFNKNGMDAQRVVIRFKTTTNNSYVVSSLYVVGNGYKYLVNAIIKDDKYKDANKRKDFDNMIESFTLDSSLLSKYLGKIVSADSLIDFNAARELKTKKYDFKTKLTKGWDILSKNSEMFGYYDKYMYMPEEYYYNDGNVSNIEYVSAFEPVSNININMTAGLNANPIDDIVSDNVSSYLRDSDIAIGVAKIKIQSAEYNGAQIFKISKEYDIKEINDFVNSDATKIYNLDRTSNIYQYIVKIGKDTFTQTITIPVSKTSDKNMKNIKSIWENTTINKVNYSTLSLNFKDRKLSEFDKMNK